MAVLKDLTVYGATRFVSDTFANNIYSNKFITNGGTSSQFVKGDGTLDNTIYATNAILANYLNRLTGGQMERPITWKNETALPQSTNLEYFLGITAFASGGQTQWTSKANALKSLTGLTSSAVGSIAIPIYWTGSAFATIQATFGSQNYGEHNANNIKSNGLWYYSSNGPTTTIGASTNDGALYSQAFSTSWVGQIAQDYRDGKLTVRGLNNGNWTDWHAVLDTSNIGIVTTKGKFYINPHLKKIVVNKSATGWDAEAYSTDGYLDNIILSFKIGQINSGIMVGLNEDPQYNANYTSIDYCWYLDASAGLKIYENGNIIQSYGNYSANDEFIIEYKCGYIYYYRNNILYRKIKRIKTTKLYFDSSFTSTSGYIYDVNFCQNINNNIEIIDIR